MKLELQDWAKEVKSRQSFSGVANDQIYHTLMATAAILRLTPNAPSAVHVCNFMERLIVVLETEAFVASFLDVHGHASPHDGTSAVPASALADACSQRDGLNVLVARLQEENQRLRELAWRHHGHQGLYGDNGEMQCVECLADYKRSAPDQLLSALSYCAIPTNNTKGKS